MLSNELNIEVIVFIRFIIVQRGRNIPTLSVLKAKHSLLNRSNKNYSHFTKTPKLLQGSKIIHVHRRGFGMFVARFLKGALKLRYLVLGGAVGGGMTLQNVRYLKLIFEYFFLSNLSNSKIFPKTV